MRFFARFSNVYLEVNLSMIYTFLKQVKEKYSYKWVRKTDHRVLIIYGNERYELPFQEKGNKVYLSIEELTTNEKSFALTLNQLLFEARKKQMDLLSIKDKSRRKSKKIHHEQLTSRNDVFTSDQDNVGSLTTTSQPNHYVIQSEIDYLLMDLYEAMQIQDQEKITWCKNKLREMLLLKAKETS